MCIRDRLGTGEILRQFTHFQTQLWKQSRSRTVLKHQKQLRFLCMTLVPNSSELSWFKAFQISNIRSLSGTRNKMREEFDDEFSFSMRSRGTQGPEPLDWRRLLSFTAVVLMFWFTGNKEIGGVLGFFTLLYFVHHQFGTYASTILFLGATVGACLLF